MAWIADLNRRFLREQRRNDLTLELTYAGAAREEVLEVVRSEQACCAFLEFEVHEEPCAVRVMIRAREATDTVFAPFLASGAAGEGCGCCGAVR